MAPSRTRTIGFVTAIAAGALALRPVGVLERVLDLALLPGRVLASMAAPVGMLQGREGRAAMAARIARDALDLEAHRALETRVRNAAWPQAGMLSPEHGAVQAEVIGHTDHDLDVLRLSVAQPERVFVGQPVIAGDALVGRISRIPGREPPPPPPRGFFERLEKRLGLGAAAPNHSPNEVLVELVTARDARIGARIERAEDGAPSRFVVGGLAPLAGTPFLAVHNPERRAVASGEVRVFEPESLSNDLSRLADGFRIGELRREAAPVPGADFTREVLGVRPYLDYEAGLHQVLILTSDGVQERVPASERTVLEDDRWSAAQFLLRAEPSPWREGRKLDRGRRHGVTAGAAVASGARLVGRVLRAGLVMSDVGLPGDVGFTLSVLADPLTPDWYEPGVDADSATQAPLVLGRIVSLGREADGAVAFAWRPQRALAQSERVLRLLGEQGALPVTLWTGSGEAGVPRGLLLGTTSLPTGPGPHVLRVFQADGGRAARALRVRTTASGRGAGGLSDR
ncbi:MAG: hypothetical protein R3F49_17125 [Planctomycetota bacterium]